MSNYTKTIARAASLLWLFASCEARTETPTQLLVVVNSNFEPERELASVMLRVDGKERAQIAIKADEGAEVPFSFGVVPPGGDANAKVTIEAEARTRDDLPLACPVRAHVGFIAGQARVVQLELTRACGSASCTCSESQTCQQGECVAYGLDVKTLLEVEPGRELEGVERTPSTTLPAPDRPVCNEDNGAWSDVGRTLSKNHDGELCPVMSDGTAWGAATNSIDENRQALSAYIARHLQVEHDVITLQVAWIDDALRVVGLAALGQDALALPTLEETLQLPILQTAEQPLQLVFHTLEGSTWLQTLPRLLLDSGVVRQCRPLYLTAFGNDTYGALRQLRESIRTQPRWSALWNHLHFMRRLTAPQLEAALAELEEAVSDGFDRVGIDAERLDLPVLRSRTRALDVLTHYYNATYADQLAGLCDGSSGLEAWLSTERPPEIAFFDELRFHLSSARTLIDLNVSDQPADATSIEYRGFPDLSLPRDVELESGHPTLVRGDKDTLWGEADTVLRFSAELEQRLPLHDATFNVERPERKYFAWPTHTLMVTARLPRSLRPEDPRQVLVSKLRGESGWALQFLNEGEGTVIQYLWYGQGREDKAVTLLKGSVLMSRVPMQLNGPITIYAHKHRIRVLDREAGVLAETDMNAFHQHIMIDNDAPITLGADPEGGGYFNGDIQSVKLSAMYEGFENTR
jgi:hypothetical protein